MSISFRSAVYPIAVQLNSQSESYYLVIYKASTCYLELIVREIRFEIVFH